MPRQIKTPADRAALWHDKGKRLTDMACRAETTFPRRAIELHAEAAEAFREAMAWAQLPNYPRSAAGA